ncbi:MAG: hypothetical protein Q7R35_05060 [Elusimicrobiota bacterium]|nr:hypothetical protein [Elusimicrobiota bacterium]
MKKTILILLAAAAGYCVLLAKPDLYYNKSMEYKNFTLRARGPLPERPDAVLDNAIAKIAVSEFATPDTKLVIYLPGSRGEFLFFTAFLSGDYSSVHPFTGAIFIAAADFKGDLVRTAPGAAEYRILSTEITGAAARELIRRTMKPLMYIILSDWKLRGYSERLSGGTGAFKPADTCSGKADDSSLQDYKYGLAVEFAMKEENMSFPELMKKDYSFESIEARMKKFNCGG